MTREYVSRLLALDAVAKEVLVADGTRYRVQNAEQWSAEPAALLILQEGVGVYIAYRNIAAIRVIDRPSEEA